MNANIVALRFIDAVKPLADDLKPEFRKKLSNYLISDLCKISSTCLISGGSIGTKELIIMILVLTSIKVCIGGANCGPFTLPVQLNKYLQSWDSFNIDMKKELLVKLRDCLSFELSKCIEKSNNTS